MFLARYMYNRNYEKNGIQHQMQSVFEAEFVLII